MKEKDSPQRARARDAFFDEFWAAYPGPRKKDKRKCREKYALIFRDASDPLDLQAKILAGIERWKRCKDWLEDGGAFICAPLVWLRNERWEAEVAPAVVTFAAPKTREISRPASYLKPTQEQINKVKGLF